MSKQSYRSYLGLDCGMNTFLRPSLYKAFHTVHLDGKPESGDTPYLICGQVCEKFRYPPPGATIAEPRPPGPRRHLRYRGLRFCHE